jgi:hypothetical protein
MKWKAHGRIRQAVIHTRKSRFRGSQIVELWIAEHNVVRPQQALQGMSPYQIAAHDA